MAKKNNRTSDAHRRTEIKTVGDALTVTDLFELQRAARTLSLHRLAIVDRLAKEEAPTSSLREVIDAVEHFVRDNVGCDVDVR